MTRSLLLLPLALAGCVASSQIPAAQTEQRRIDITTGDGATIAMETVRDANIRTDLMASTAERLWPHLAQVYADLQLSATLVDPATHRVGVVNARAGRQLAGRRPSYYLDCGSGIAGNNADHYDVYFTLMTQLVPVEGGTEARSRMEAYARDGAHNNNPVSCGTKGLLELAIGRRLRERAGLPVPTRP